MKFNQPVGSTPLTHDNLYSLIPAYITTQGELDTAEQENIAKAIIWLFGQNLSTDKILNEQFFKKLHKQMFSYIWKWAGKFRQHNTNIGCDWPNISIDLRNLIDDTKYQINNNIYSTLEISIRFHHRLVWIHPFPNGNGRHARIITEFILSKISNIKLTWGGFNINNQTANSKIRTNYIRALRQADKGDYKPLIDFSISGVVE